MKQSAGLTQPAASAVNIVGMIASLWLLATAMKTLPLGTAYTIWTGIGAIGAFMIGIAVLGETILAVRLLAAILVVSGIVIMKLSSDYLALDRARATKTARQT